jgi:hypothetical protein
MLVTTSKDKQYVFLGHYIVRDRCLVNAAKNTVINVEHFETSYRPRDEYILYYPVGNIQCAHCNATKPISKSTPCYAMHTMDSLVCFDCRIALSDHQRSSPRLLNIETDSPSLLRKQAKQRYTIRHQTAIRQQIMQWACKFPDGPLYKMIKRNHTNHDTPAITSSDKLGALGL